MTTESNRARRSLHLVILLACLLYAGLLAWVGFEDFTRALSRLSLYTWVEIVLLVSLGYILRFVRWQYYLHRCDSAVPILPSFRIFLASFSMAISPGKVGETLKSYLLKKEFGASISRTLAAFFCERFTDVLSMVLLSAAGFLVYPHGWWMVLAVALVQGAVLVLVLHPSIMERWVFSPLESLNWFQNWIQRGRRFYRTAETLLQGPPLLIGTGIGVLSWGVEGFCLWRILEALGIVHLPAWIGIFIFSASVLLGAISMLPGGLGSSEALMVGMLLYFGVPRAPAISATILVRLATLWYGVVLGFAAWGLSFQHQPAASSGISPGAEINDMDQA